MLFVLYIKEHCRLGEINVSQFRSAELPPLNHQKTCSYLDKSRLIILTIKYFTVHIFGMSFFCFALFLFAAIPLLFTGCVTRVPPSVDTWFQTQQKMAAIINKYNGGTNFTIAAITGPIYPIGTTIWDNSPDDGCQFTTNVIKEVNVAEMPEFFYTNGFSTSIAVPSSNPIMQAIKAVVSANAGGQKEVFMHYSNVTQEFVYDSALRNECSSNSCVSTVINAGGPVSIIRGQWLCKLEISSTNSFNIGLTVSVTNIANFSVSYGSGGGFYMQQTNPTAWFNVYSNVKRTQVKVNSENAVLPNGNFLGYSLEHHTNDTGLMAAEAELNDLKKKNITLDFYDFDAPDQAEAEKLSSISR